MTQEEKAKAYDEMMRLFSNRHKSETDIGIIDHISVIYPELAESEDERIRKDILVVLERAATKFFKEEGKMPVWYDGAIAWLKKQGEKSLMTDEKIKEKAFKAYPELISHDLTTGLMVDKNKNKREGYIHALSEVMEEQGKQKFTNQVEPKFHVGDWCIDNEDGTIFQITKVLDNTYAYKTNEGNEGYYCTHYSIEKDCHLWTIQDAKPGEILVAPPMKGSEHPEQIFIFKEIKDREYVRNAVEYYCRCTNDEFAVNERGFMGQAHDYFTPATKEQCELLSQKMKEAGYKWENNQLEKINDEGFVDLGLPSGTLWSKFNLGAEKEIDFGNFYQWGDVQEHEGSADYDFSWNTYKWGTQNNLIKYNSIDNNLVLNNEDDPVYSATDGKMKSPTKEQWEELIANTNHQWIYNFKESGINGIKFTNKNDSTKYIFIPAAGYYYGYTHYAVNSWVYVWLSSCDSYNPNYAWNMGFDSGTVSAVFNYRYLGFSMRGVMNK